MRACGARTFSGMTGAISRVLSLSGHLSGTRVTARLKPPVGTAGPAMVPVGVAADRVYRPPMLPWGAVSSYLAFPPLPAAAKPRRRYISVALFLGSPPADVIRYPCPVQPGLSSCQRHAAACTSHDNQYTVKNASRQTGLTKNAKILYTVMREKGGVRIYDSIGTISRRPFG